MPKPPHSSRLFETPQGAGSVRVRRAGPDDIDAAMAILDDVETGAAEALRARGVEPVPSREIVGRLIRRGELLMAQDPGGATVGVARVEDKGAAAEIGWAVSRDRLGTGVPAEIVDALAFRLLCAGYWEVHAQVPAAAKAARGLLQDFGFSLRKTISGDMRFRANHDSWNAADARRGGRRPEMPAPGRGAGGPNGEQGIVIDPRKRDPSAGKGDTLAAVLEDAPDLGDVRLRAAELSDMPALAALGDGLPGPKGAAPDPDDMIRPILDGAIAVAEDPAGRVVASLSCKHASWKRGGGVEIGWVVASDMRRRGIGTLIARAATERLLDVGHAVVSCRMLADNEPSRRVAEAIGMSCIAAEGGTMRFTVTAADRVPSPAPAPR